MKDVTLTFKYEIGDVVIAKVILQGMLEELNLLDSTRFPEGVRVIARCSEECVAGPQLSYLCEAWNGQHFKHAEASVVPIAEAYDAAFALHVKKRLEKEKKPAETQSH